METKTHAPGRLAVSAARSPLRGVSSIFYDNHVFGAEDAPPLSELQEREPQHDTLEELYARCNARKKDENLAKEWIDKLLTGTRLTGTSQASRPRPPSLATKFETLQPSSALPLYAGKFTPFHSTELIKPDVTIVTKERRFPILTVEVYSETWAQTIKKHSLVSSTTSVSCVHTTHRFCRVLDLHFQKKQHQLV